VTGRSPSLTAAGRVPDLTEPARVESNATRAVTMPGQSSTKARLLRHESDLRFAWLTGEVSTKAPLSIEIHLTNVCNLRCSFCSYGRVRHQEMLHPDQLTTLVDDLVGLAPTLKAVVFSGGGEPTVHPGFAEAVARLADAGIEIGVITNGVRMPPAVLEAFLRCAWVRFSLDAPDPAHYQKVLSPHDPKNYTRVLENMAALSAARGPVSPPAPVLGLAYLVDRGCQTDELLLTCLDIGAQAGADYVHYRPIFMAPDLEITRPVEELRALAPVIDAHARELGIAHQYPKFLGTYGKTVGQRPNARDARCPVVSDGLIAMVAATGDVLPCYAHLMHDRKSAFGNLAEQRFADIWNGPLRQKVVAAIDAKNTCPFCRFQAGNAMLHNLGDQRTGGELQVTPGYEQGSLKVDMGYTVDLTDPHWKFL
jgi:radical SAM protein with 4Fe4S-binding SPASM domain